MTFVDDVGDVRYLQSVPADAPNSAVRQFSMQLMDGTWVPSRAVDADLLPKLRAKGWFIDQGSTAERHLEQIGALGRYLGDQRMMVPKNAKQLAVLEEFLHHTQSRIRKLDSLQGPLREAQVKDFMIRHQRLLGLTDEEVEILVRQRDSYRVLARTLERNGS